jgi:hypothetical protein
MLGGQAEISGLRLLHVHTIKQNARVHAALRPIVGRVF